ncbi:MAG: alpha/beta hydrolase [Syntrophobacterales bacterium]|jgi:pimeloyl-ACP methyl ester carboxylesterase|nr:alpha/beta hydrolase [Syntrophobacterales bacterium]
MKYQRWYEAMKNRAFDGAKYIETKLGTIHYTDIGDSEGVTILHSHGSPAGADIGPLFFGDFIGRGHRVMTPSRPGFLGTALGLGDTVEAQADFFKVFLDSMNVKSVFVHAWSGGGPPAIRFAMKYPEYVNGLILFCALSHKWEHKITNFEKMILSDKGIWIMWNLSKVFKESFRRKNAKELGASYDYIKGDPAKLRFLDSFFEMTAPPSLRNDGSFNDIKMYRDMPDFDFSRIAVPTLILFSPSDNQLPVSNGDIPAEKIPSHLVDYYRFTHGGHMPMIDREWDGIRDKMLDFIADQPRKRLV